MKNAAKNKRPNKKIYNKLNRETKRARRVEAMAAAAAQNAVPIVHLAENVPNNATNQYPATNGASPAVLCASCINTTFEKERRELVVWTPEEVAMLKILLLKHTRSFKKPGPWAKMLREGRSVFNKCRTGGDLKDKWRNILPHWLKEEEEEEEAQKHQTRA
ncbi:hypothetical protein MKW94_012324 [Papaver nudicaule]|uniref:Myb-like domain-containing protein n=1 Tax=Papaver nudicaule TaxID=74823 RepID=A0AA41RVF7_PAPNU|nr:hypothetical protein [Papaver nudicaule]